MENGKNSTFAAGKVGLVQKTTIIVEEFAKNEYTSYLMIDFSKISDEQRDIFDSLLINKIHAKSKT